MHTLVVQVYALAGHAHVGTCTCIRAIDLVHGFVNMQGCTAERLALQCSRFNMIHSSSVMFSI